MQTLLNARKVPAVGWVTTKFAVCMMTPPPTGTSATFTEFPAAAPPPDPVLGAAFVVVPVPDPPLPDPVDVSGELHAASPSPARVKPMPAAKRLRRGTSGDIWGSSWVG